MRREEGIHTTGRIVETLGAGRFRARLPNGKIVFAYFPRTRRERGAASPGIGDPVPLRLSPYDLSRAEITDRPGA